MYLGNADIELLHLAAWCKNLPTDMSKMIHSQILCPSRIKLLDRVALVNVSENGRCIRLRELGWDFVRYLGGDYHKDQRYVSDYERRIESSRILLTFWRAGFDVFEATLRDLGSSRVFVSSMAARRGAVRGGDIWGGAAFWGLARLGNTVISCYHFTGHEKTMLNFGSEKAMLDKAAAVLGAKPAMIFAGRGSMGSGYEKMAKVLGKTKSAKASGAGEKLTCADIYATSQFPVHLLECSDIGALQLLIMAQDDYRKRLGNVMFHGSAPPPVGVTSADGLLQHTDSQSCPWMLAVDMDICRISRAIRQTVSAGYPMIVIACLSIQRAALKLLFGEEIARYVGISEKNVVDAFGALCLYEPAPGPYNKGGMIDAADLPVRRKVGKQAHRKNTEVQE